MEKVVVGVGAVLFDIDFRMKCGMFGCQGLDLSFVHRSNSLRSLTRDRNIIKSLIFGFVATLCDRCNGSLARPVVSLERRDDRRCLL